MSIHISPFLLVTDTYSVFQLYIEGSIETGKVLTSEEWINLGGEMEVGSQNILSNQSQQKWCLDGFSLSVHSFVFTCQSSLQKQVHKKGQISSTAVVSVFIVILECPKQTDVVRQSRRLDVLTLVPWKETERQYNQDFIFVIRQRQAFWYWVYIVLNDMCWVLV